jgi:hypothetical protein
MQRNIKLSSLISHLVKDVLISRVISDNESLSVARLYQKDAMQKHLPVPRMVISEMELDIPAVISSIDSSLNKRLLLDKQTFAIKMKEELGRLLNQHQSVFTLESSEMGDIIIDIHALYNKIAKSLNENDALNILHEGYTDIFNKVFRRINYASSTTMDDTIRHAQAVDFSLTQMHNLVSNSYVFIEDDVKNIWLDPTTESIIKAQSSDNIVRIKIKLVEESINIESIKDGQGKVSNVVTLN